MGAEMNWWDKGSNEERRGKGELNGKERGSLGGASGGEEKRRGKDEKGGWSGT